MPYTGINLGNVKVNNRSAILQLLNDGGATTRKDIAEKLGLTPATVTLITSELLNAGIIYERGEVKGEKRAGRRKVLIDINENHKYVLTIVIEEAETVISVCNLKGSNLYSKSLQTNKDVRPEAFLDSISSESIYLMWEAGITRELVLGVGVSIPGPVDREMGIAQHAYRIWDEEVPIAEILRNRLNYPIIVENNVHAFAEGELIYGIGKSNENLFIVKWGPGVGSSIIIGNRIYDRRNSKSGEIGHVIVRKDGKACRCGRRGCLETYVSTHSISDNVREKCAEGAFPELAEYVGHDMERISSSGISDWIQCEDPAMWEGLNQVFDCLAKVISNCVTLLAPDKVILYGKMFELPHFEAKLREAMRELHEWKNPDFCVLSELEDKRWFIGPLAVVVSELFLLSGGEGTI